MNKKGTVLTEEDWTPDVLHRKYGFYAIGKAQAEREAWNSYHRMPGMRTCFGHDLFVVRFTDGSCLDRLHLTLGKPGQPRLIAITGNNNVDVFA